MSEGWIVVRGESHVTLEAAAECFRVEAEWVVEVYEHGLLGQGEKAGASVAVAATALDRLAEVLRMHRHHGLDLDAIEVLLESARRP